MRSVKLLSRNLSVIFRRDLPLISPLLRSFYAFQSKTHQSLSFSTLPSNSINIPVHCFPNKFPKLFCSVSDLPKCWNCNSSPKNSSNLFLVCYSCRCIQPLDPSLDYFRIFGLEQKYDIEESSLEGIYKDWQKKLHPDLVHTKSQRERDYAAEQSARVIDAYRTLKNPLSRAIYLMKLQGVHVDEEQTVSDPELLAEVMEIRESVEDAPDTKALKCIQAEVQEKLGEWSETFAGAFKSQNTEEALNAIRRMTYFKRANEEIMKRL